jgi:hypothetical membrane protein
MTAAPDNSKSVQLLKRVSLLSAACMPIFYYGAQLVAAPFYPGYSFSNQAASMLGTSYSREPWIFNTGLILTGVAAMVGAFGLYQTFRNRTNRILCALIALTVSYTGFMSIKAGVFPIPDRRHYSLGFSVVSASLTPLLMLIGIWRNERLRGLRTYLLLSILLLVPVIPLFRGMIAIAGLAFGTLQRLVALGTYVPIGVVGIYFFLQDRQNLRSLKR